MKTRICELCNREATLYCASDSAFLCWSCDEKVHAANFLVARHVRRTICSQCKAFTGYSVAGVGFQHPSRICPGCSPAADSDSVSSASSFACVSSTATAKRRCSNRREACKFDALTEVNETSGEVTSSETRREVRQQRRVDGKAEEVFASWCNRLGLGRDMAVIRMACNALSLCLDHWAVLPFRVLLAASFRFGLRFSGNKSVSTWQSAKRVEEISGVPAKLFSSVEMRLERVLKARRQQRETRRRHEAEEGWAECSV